VGTGLLFQVSVGAVLVGLFSAASQASSASTAGIQPWVFVMVYSAFAGQGAALAIAFASHVRARWGRVLGERTGEVVAWRTARVRSWPEHHLAGMAEAIAGMAVAVALVCGYWAAGGSFGVSRVLPDVPWGLQASRVVGAVTAAVGLLGLAGRWGQRTRFWLPAALTWVGSGAGGRLRRPRAGGLAPAREDASAPGWSLTDTVLVIKAVIGMLAGAVGALAVTAATKDNHLQRALPERVEVRPVEVSAAGSRRTAARSVPARRCQRIPVAAQLPSALFKAAVLLCASRRHGGCRRLADKEDLPMKRIALAVVAALTLLLGAGAAAADPDFGPGNSSKGPNDGGAKCHPPGQTEFEPGCK
jgi:hypothetical protein